MRVHLLAVPNTMTTRAFYLDGFAQMNIRFATLLKKMGHEVILYGGDENEAHCDVHISCIPKAEQARLIGETPYQSVDFNAGTELFMRFNATAAAVLGNYKKPHDIIATIGGSSHQPVSNQHPELIFLEYSIGYRGITAPYRIYQSHAWRHVVHGYTGIDGGREFDDVIPPFFDVEEFPFTAYPKDYVVYLGRIVPRKGVVTACDAAKAAGVPLKVMGFGDPSIITYGEHLGAVPPAERNAILSQARAVLVPTQYIEPFGNVVAEAQLCGVPVISTNYGGFVESVEHGVSGYRCSYLGAFVQAIKDAESLDRAAIRARARKLWSMETAAKSYEAYFDRLALLQGEGWPSLAPPRRTVMESV
jgi:glycosyltransferase involved in cell wall biosynthesis